MKIQIQKNFYSYFLIIPMILFLIPLLHYYLKYGMTLPMGWDAPTYVYLANEVLRTGPLAYMRETHDVEFYVQLLALLGFVLSDTKFAQAMLPIIISFPYIFLYYKLTFNVTRNSHVLALLAAVLASFGFQLCSFQILPRQLLAYTFTLYLIWNFSWIDSVWSSPKDAKGLLLIFVSALLAWTHLYTYLFFGLSLCLLYILARRRKILVFGIASLVVSLSILLLLDFTRWLSTWIFNPEMQFLLTERQTLGTLFSHMGGNVLLFSIALFGLVELLRNWKHERDTTVGMLLSWGVIIFVISLIAFPRRTLLLIPTPLLLAVGFGRIRNFLVVNKARFFEKFSLKNGFVRKINLLLLLEIGLVCLLIIPSVLLFVNEVEKQHPRISVATYNKILLIKELLLDYAEEPVVAFYGRNAMWFVSYYRGVIAMEIGRHYAYYGPLPYLIQTIPPSMLNFHFYPAIELMQAELYFEEMSGHGVEIASHPIIVIQDDFYGFSSALLRDDFVVSDGVYMIPPNRLNSNLLDSWILTCYSDYYNLTQENTQVISKETAPNGEDMVAQYALEHYEVEDTSPFLASYLVVLKTEFQYEVSIHLRDYNESMAPLRFYLDENLVYIHSYNGSGNFTWVSFDLPIIGGPHILETVIDDTQKPHAVTLDVIKVIPKRD